MSEPLSPETPSPDVESEQFNDFIMIRSLDGEEFVVPKYVAQQSGLLRRMIEGDFREAASVIRLPQSKD
ncbi:hypothetical protein P9112_000178 [Eukaryota sp. TZLM1-RC]